MKHLQNTVYVTTPLSYLHMDNGNVVVKVDDGVLARIPLHLLEGIVLFGSLGISPALMGECIERGISVSFLAMNGKFLARVDGEPRGNVLLRRKQYRVADDENCSLDIAKRFISAKVFSQRSVLQRFHRDYPAKSAESLQKSIEAVKVLYGLIPDAGTRDELMGIEGKAADHYFAVFGSLITVPGFAFNGRSRRPPRDEANALLSFFYTLLAHDVAAACNTVGLDPYVGFFHVDRPGRTSLALDLMEELRPYIVDRFVLSLLNRRQVDSGSFFHEPDGGVTLNGEERKRVLALWQKRKQEEILHPFLGEKIALGLLPYVQAQLMARYLRGDMDDYPAFIWR